MNKNSVRFKRLKKHFEITLINWTRNISITKPLGPIPITVLLFWFYENKVY
jgi:hypothetical protein